MSAQCAGILAIHCPHVMLMQNMKNYDTQSSIKRHC